MNELKLDTQLKKLTEELETVRRALPDASNLKWQEYLQKAKYLGISFASLVEAVTPEMRHYVPYPSHYDPQLPIPSLLCSSEDSALVTESELCRQRLAEKLQEMGLDNVPAMRREESLLDQVKDHNRLCEEVVKMTASIIEREDLRETTEIAPVRMRAHKVKRRVAMVVSAVGSRHDEEGEVLPVPHDLKG